MTAWRNSREAAAERRRAQPSPEAQAFALYFGINPLPARLLAELYGARGPVTHEVLIGRLVTTLAALRTAISEVREAMDPGAYQTLYGYGYQLTAGGMAECERALAEAIAVSDGEGVGGSNAVHRAA